jgi:hypothetical protein
MCNRYVSPSSSDLERLWHLKSNGIALAQRDVFPLGSGAFVRAKKESDTENELVVGQWDLIP